MRQYPVAVAIPVTGDKIADRSMERQIAKVAASGARFIEFRLDYATNPGGLDLDYLVLEATKLKLETIMTCRVAREGGFYDPDEKGTQETIVEKMIGCRPDFIDIELGTRIDILSQAVNLCNEHFVKIILSHHDLKGTPPIQEARAFVGRCMEKINQIGMRDGVGIVLKLVFTATAVKDNVIPLNMIDILDMNDIPAISFCMGDAGILSRVMSIARRGKDKKPGFLTYAALDTSTAPGQLHVEEMMDLLEYLL